MVDREALVFAPSNKPPREWYVEILGAVIKPAIVAKPPTWFWFGCYPEPWTDKCEAATAGIPRIEFESHGRQRFAKLRYRVDDREPFEAFVSARAAEIQCAVYFDNYDLVKDLGKPRYLAPTHDTCVSAASRADSVVSLLHAASRLTLECLYSPADGSICFEENADPNNPTKFIADSLTHLFYNMSGIYSGFLPYPTVIAVRPLP